MKNPKVPTRRQKKILQSYGLDVDSFLVVKSLPDTIEVAKRSDLEKYRNESHKIRTRKLSITEVRRNYVKGI